MHGSLANETRCDAMRMIGEEMNIRTANTRVFCTIFLYFQRRRCAAFGIERRIRNDDVFEKEITVL